MKIMTIVLGLFAWSSCYVGDGDNAGTVKSDGEESPGGEMVMPADGKYYVGQKEVRYGGLAPKVRGIQLEGYWAKETSDMFAEIDFKDGTIAGFKVKIDGKCYSVDFDADGGLTRLQDEDGVDWSSDIIDTEEGVRLSVQARYRDTYPPSPASVSINVYREGVYTRQSGRKTKEMEAESHLYGEMLPTDINKRNFKKLNPRGNKVHPKKVREQFQIGDICGSTSEEGS